MQKVTNQSRAEEDRGTIKWLTEVQLKEVYGKEGAKRYMEAAEKNPANVKKCIFSGMNLYSRLEEEKNYSVKKEKTGA